MPNAPVDQAGSDGRTATALRPDGRTATQLRPMLASRGPLCRADGSARWSLGDTCVVAGVYGPRGMGVAGGGLAGGGAAAGQGKEDPLRASLQVIWAPRNGLAGSQERYCEAVVRQTVDAVLLSSLLPRTRIQLQLQVVHDDGSLLPCALNAAFAALLDAGLPLSCLPAAVQLALDSQGQLLLDPTKEEQQTSSATLCTVFASRPLAPDGAVLATVPSAVPGGAAAAASSSGQEAVDGMITCEATGRIKALQYVEALERAELACRVIDAFSRTGLEQYQKRREVLSA
ncbi:hypothetical protein CLOM_g20815 [Closterium sp. NIES-68]|nr:hypothetical protein CLOM_g20815 [Closterium sp. NIES-68]GJP73749.1 hypothetical protein CLOP_g4436 [Closterium sp. NIES-67]